MGAGAQDRWLVQEIAGGCGTQHIVAAPKHNVAGADPFLAEELRLIAPPTAQNEA